ncbi:MAG: hypothetical protein ACJ8J0_05500 [Longimicrobiaceae bacterium]
MTLRFSCACCVVLAGCGPIAPAAAPSPAGVAPGTYAMEICRGPCHGRAGDSVLVRGHLVIEAAEYPLSELPPVARKYLEERDDLMLMGDDDSVLDPNACFVLTQARVGYRYGVGLTRANAVRGDTVKVDLYRSPDSGYFVVLRAAAGELRGWGRGWSYPPVDSPGAVPLDSVRARRIGRPDRALCIRAAEIEAAAWEAQRTPSRP